MVLHDAVSFTSKQHVSMQRNISRYTAPDNPPTGLRKFNRPAVDVDREAMATDDERRIGPRYESYGINVSWRIDQARRVLGRAPGPGTAYIVDYSASGACLVAPTMKGAETSKRALLEWEGGKAIVSIRHIEPGDQPGTSRYGVLFEELSPRFARLIDEHVAGHRPSSIEAKRPEWSRTIP
jgi:hypothetical protein